MGEFPVLTITLACLFFVVAGRLVQIEFGKKDQHETVQLQILSRAAEFETLQTELLTARRQLATAQQEVRLAHAGLYGDLHNCISWMSLSQTDKTAYRSELLTRVSPRPYACRDNGVWVSEDNCRMSLYELMALVMSGDMQVALSGGRWVAKLVPPVITPALPERTRMLS